MSCRLSLTWFLATVVSVSAADLDPKKVAFFENKIRPVLVTHCYECHSDKAAKLKGGLLLDSREGLLKGGDTGPSVIPGKPNESLLIKSLRQEKLKMPPKNPLPAHIVADFVQWVADGAIDPRTGGSSYKRLSAEEAKSFWSFVPPKQPAIPSLKDTTWARTDADRFIRAKLEEKGLKVMGDADRATLARRIYFDLIGLPPTPEQLDAFVSDKSAKAAEKLVDDLLASQQFGERWGRHWLDIARYGESNGNSDNLPFPEAWRYRNYVIASVNADKPYDQFIREQVAGDLLIPKDAKQKDEFLIATAFLALTSKPRAQNNPDYAMDLVADQVDVTTRAVLGLSVLCARCHDHKFDPIGTKEYYGLAGIFNSSTMLFGAGGKGAAKGGKGGGLLELSDGSETMGLREGKAGDIAVCIRGDSTKRGETVSRGFIAAATTKPTSPVNRSQSGRKELAEWLIQGNPFVARVAVNRIWLHLFGKAIVNSPDNFGFLGERPSHPELLDHLAVQFLKDGWSTKKMIRSLVLSRTYQMAHGHDEASYKTDPDNIYHWRAAQRRLDAEAQRDAILSIARKLDMKPVNASLAGGAKVNPKKNVTAAPEVFVRSVYLGVPRGRPLPESLAIFDAANPNIVVAQREETTVPSQALFLLNSPFVVEMSVATAQRLMAEAKDDSARLDLAYRLYYGRLPTDDEKSRGLKYIVDEVSALPARDKSPEGGKATAWASFAQAMIASAEFRYVR